TSSGRSIDQRNILRRRPPRNLLAAHPRLLRKSSAGGGPTPARRAGGAGAPDGSFAQGVVASRTRGAQAAPDNPRRKRGYLHAEVSPSADVSLAQRRLGGGRGLDLEQAARSRRGPRSQSGAETRN